MEWLNKVLEFIETSATIVRAALEILRNWLKNQLG